MISYSVKLIKTKEHLHLKSLVCNIQLTLLIYGSDPFKTRVYLARFLKIALHTKQRTSG